MTREEARKAAEVMLAYADGKDIEYKLKGNIGWMTFRRDDNERQLCFDFTTNEYRIKPESTYRPFKSKDECWAEMQKHQPFGWVKDKDNKAYIDIEMIGGDSDDCGINDVEYPRIFNEFNFADGTPFGIEVKE